MLGSKSCIAQNSHLVMNICELLLEAHNKISALNFVHIDVISRFNEFLLTFTPAKGSTIDSLVEITAEIHRKQFERGSISPNPHSPYF